ncbi:hypothetical protein L1987_22387 [Smallanthus sonchifolius]|uniref:Uncharacterized protein n=1 Tax=Smallanthus sonchifolius TaxID=185202 RepID=A0ACB9IGG0_9ASTR|nr:hypothetical protein L1987_22387 [Smallanthus sonchifolius]
MVKSNTTIMTVSILVGLIFTALPCLEALSPMGAPMMSPGTPMPMKPALAPAPDCLTALTNVTDCLTFVQDGSNLTVPDKACCPEFAGLLESNPICLCELIGQAKNYAVNVTKALTLPSVCKVQAPPVSACPAPTPSSESEAPGSASEAPGSEAGPGPNGGVAVSPAGSGNDGNGASGTAVHDLSTIICLALAIFIAYYF